MKTAIILFAPMDDKTHPGIFLSVCADKAQNEGFTILHTTHWDYYKNIDTRELVKRTMPIVDAVFMFVDLGITPLMTDIINEAYFKTDAGHVFLKDIRIEIAMNGKLISIQAILREVSNTMSISIDTLKTKTRKREVVEARQFYFKRAKLFTKASLASIGALVGKDHATVLYGIKTVENVSTVKEKYEQYFEGRVRPVKAPIPVIKKPVIKPPKEQLTKQDKAILIGQLPVTAKVANMTSPYAAVESANNRGYSGYRSHSL